MMPPMLIEIRQGPECWLYRSADTGGRWHDSHIGQDWPAEYVKNTLKSIWPDYAVRWPEQDGMRWEDC